MNKVKKQEQEVINYVSKNLYDMALKEECIKPSKSLHNCNARVFETENFYILQSYSTIVAVIEKHSDIMADVKFMNYDFEASDHTCKTTSQHIRKFCKDYGTYEKRCKIEYRYYPVN